MDVNVGSQDMKVVNRIMLRFRPIAPKPVTDGSETGSKPEDIKNEPVTKPRRKRKYVRVKKNSNCNNIIEEEERKDGSVVTLQLLPESSSSSANFQDNGALQNEISFSHKYDNNGILAISSPDQFDLKVAMQTPRMVESWVMVDGMTKTFADEDALLGSTDMEKMKNLETDTCPGLISDGLGFVQWVNPAYRRMVADGGPTSEMVVRLVMKEKIVSEELPRAFACSVRVVYSSLNSKQSRIMPCDVWKMEFGGFAWRFDSKAALSLGR
ncbi:uncharacterized protein LOC132619290 [Lycium barbarum]|uniref:uncharacterized protein LOC132619290 n=1 Tax=Lycium barbarum TaxID=112863 RepID=UPI00293E959B|nr:uncharacterized protein LOC132619290 [Lycium barbarum]